MGGGPHVYIDADACPVKAEAVKVADRHDLAVTFVANAWLQAPRGLRVRTEVVSGAFDAADDNIGNALATRELMADLRAYGIGGGPPPFDARDRSRFLQALELAIRDSQRSRSA
jgi:uncharacterized protein YaiI (UPF0178 family)